MLDYVVRELPVNKIYSDEDFNCRGKILKIDVADLARDIAENGLQFPITVQPGANLNLPDDYDFRIIAGHRRFAAFIVLEKEAIPCMIRENLNEVQARLLNLSENLKRKELDILQEARAIKKLRDLGLVQEKVAAALGATRSWVQVRFNLLDLPVEIQNEAAAGILNQSQIKQLYSLPTKEDQFEAVKKIKNSLEQGVRGLDVSTKPKDNPFKAKRQAKNVVEEMIILIGQSCGYGLATRALAWANGSISSMDLFLEIKAECEKQGKTFVMPFKQ